MRVLWRNVHGFLFGPPHAPRDALSDERRLTALIAERRGIVTMIDLVALFGWSPEQAEGELARILVDYGGEVTFKPGGALYFRFDALGSEARVAPSAADVRPFYEREGDPPAFWGCDPAVAGLTLAAIGLALASLWLHPGGVPLQGIAGEAVIAAAWHRTLQGSELYLYASVLLPPLLRLPFWLRERARLQARRSFGTVVRAALEHPAGSAVPAMSAADLLALDAEVDPTRATPNGTVWIRFPAIAASAAAADEARRLAVGAPAPVTLDTHDGEADEALEHPDRG